MAGSEGQPVADLAADVPAMPELPSGAVYPATARALAPRSGRFFIGWQPPTRKDGTTFVVGRVSMLSDLKVTGRFPATEEGWQLAWQALVILDVATTERARVTLAELAAERRAMELSAGRLPELDAATICYVPGVIYLGGHAQAELAVRGEYDLRFLADSLAVYLCRDADVVAEVAYRDVEAVDIGGPGLVKSGGGFVGGGFGVVGVAEGMAIAAILNALTTQVKIKTIIRIQGTGCELFFLCTTTEPGDLRIGLSGALGAIRRAQAEVTSSAGDGKAAAVSVVDQFAKLADMLENGLLTREEFERLKAALIAPA